MNRFVITVATLVGLIISSLLITGLIAWHNATRSAQSTSELAATSVSTDIVPSELDSSLVRESAKTRLQVLSQIKDPIVAPERSSFDRLRQIRMCEMNQSENCPINDLRSTSSPDGYMQILVEQTISELAFLRALAEKAHADEINPPFSVEEVAAAYIKHPDDDVREQALGLAALLPVRDAKVASAIAIRALQMTVSGPLARQALDLLARTRQGSPERVDQTLLRTLKFGGWDVRDAVAERILPFLTPENRNAFARVLRVVPVRSKLALHLRLGLEEFDRMERL